MGDPLGDVLYHRQILTIGLGLSILGFRKGFRKMMEARQEKMKVKKKKKGSWKSNVHPAPILSCVGPGPSSSSKGRY